MESRITKIVGLDYGSTSLISSSARERAWAAASAIENSGFAWSATAEGFAFWNSVQQRLLAISKGEPLR